MKTGRSPRNASDVEDYELIAQELSELGEKIRGLDVRLAEVERVNARLEDAALTTARSPGGVPRHLGAARGRGPGDGSPARRDLPTLGRGVRGDASLRGPGGELRFG